MEKWNRFAFKDFYKHEKNCGTSIDSDVSEWEVIVKNDICFGNVFNKKAADIIAGVLKKIVLILFYRRVTFDNSLLQFFFHKFIKKIKGDEKVITKKTTNILFFVFVMCWKLENSSFRISMYQCKSLLKKY